MPDLNARLRSLLLQQRIQLNLIASNPRQGGTMLLIGLGCAELAAGRQVIGLWNEPGNLGVLPGCRFDAAENPRREADMDRLLLIAAQLALLQHHLQELGSAGGCDDRWLDRHRELRRRLLLPRIPGSDGGYDPRFDDTLLAEVEALRERVERHAASSRQGSAAQERPPLLLTIKEHNYNRNEAEFRRLLALVKDSGGHVLFTTRRPADCFHSFLLRRTVHFLSAEGNVSNREIAEVVERLLLPAAAGSEDPQAMLAALARWASEGFSGSGDRLDLERLRAFVGKAPGEPIDTADLRRAGQRIWDHALEILQISYANTEHYLGLAREWLPQATHRVEFEALLSAPEASLGSLARQIPWIRRIPSGPWPEDRLRDFVNVPEAFVLPGSAIERNVWFKDTLAATAIRPRAPREGGSTDLLNRDPQASAELQRTYQALLQQPL